MSIALWLTGLSSAGKTSIAERVVVELQRQGQAVDWLDGDAMRATLCRDLGFSREDRRENVRRLAFVADVMVRNGIVAIVSAISPYREDRAMARALLKGRMIEVFADAPLAVCEERDRHGVYARARAGELRMVTGVDDVYEPPLSPDVHCRTHEENLDESVAKVVRSVRGHLAKKALMAWPAS